MNRLRCGPISRNSGPVYITKYNADGTTTIQVLGQHEQDERKLVQKALDNFTTEEKLALLKKLQEVNVQQVAV